jgi:hypothetical protein
MPTQDPADLIGARVVGAEGEDVGPIEAIFEEDQTGMAPWLRVRAGLFGTKSRFIPLAAVQRSDHGIQVPFSKHQIKAGPLFGAHTHLSTAQVTELAYYYALTAAALIPEQRPDPDPTHTTSRTH